MEHFPVFGHVKDKLTGSARFKDSNKPHGSLSPTALNEQILFSATLHTPQGPASFTAVTIPAIEKIGTIFPFVTVNPASAVEESQENTTGVTGSKWQKMRKIGDGFVQGFIVANLAFTGAYFLTELLAPPEVVQPYLPEQTGIPSEVVTPDGPIYFNLVTPAQLSAHLTDFALSNQKIGFVMNLADNQNTIHFPHLPNLRNNYYSYDKLPMRGLPADLIFGKGKDSISYNAFFLMNTNFQQTMTEETFWNYARSDGKILVVAQFIPTSREPITNKKGFFFVDFASANMNQVKEHVPAPPITPSDMPQLTSAGRNGKPGQI